MARGDFEIRDGRVLGEVRLAEGSRTQGGDKGFSFVRIGFDGSWRGARAGKVVEGFRSLGLQDLEQFFGREQGDFCSSIRQFKRVDLVIVFFFISQIFFFWRQQFRFYFVSSVVFRGLVLTRYMDYRRKLFYKS